MTAEVKNIMSPDIYDLKQYSPVDKKNFSIFIEFIVGIKDKEGGDIFGIEVCTPKWLVDNLDEEIIFGRGKMIVTNFDISNIIQTITNYCNNCKGDNWKEIAQKISQIANWEFDEYKK